MQHEPANDNHDFMEFATLIAYLRREKRRTKPAT